MTTLEKLLAAPDLTALTFKELIQISNKKTSSTMGKLAKVN